MTTLQSRPLGEVLTQVWTPTTVKEDFSYPMTGIYSFGKGLIHRGETQGSETSYKTLQKLRSGQLVMSKLNAWEGALTTVPEHFDATYVSPEYPVFEIDLEEADPSYIKHLVTWPQLWTLLTPRGSMVRRKRTGSSTLLATSAPLPSLDEQRRIADKLDSTLTRVSSIEGMRDKLTTLSESIRESLVNNATEKSRQMVRMGDIMTLERTLVSIDPNSEYRIIGMRSFGKGIIRYASGPGEELSKLSFFKVPTGALTLSNIKAWEGAISVTTPIEAEDFVASVRFLTYLPRDERVNTSYIRHYLLSRDGLAKISAASPGGADRNRTLGRKRFEAIEFPLPARETQDRVARTLDAVSERIGAAHANPALNALRPSILNAAFTGRL